MHNMQRALPLPQPLGIISGNQASYPSETPRPLTTYLKQETVKTVLQQEVQTKYNSKVTVVAPSTSNWARTGIENKENTVIPGVLADSGYTLRQDFTSSPSRINKSKIASGRESTVREHVMNTQGTPLCYQPLNFQDIRKSRDDFYTQQRILSLKVENHQTSKFLFKFKVYPTRIEKCQIDEFGNEVEGGIVEVIQRNENAFANSEKLHIRELSLPPSFKLISSRYIDLPLPRESRELVMAQIQAEQKMKEDLSRHQEQMNLQRRLIEQQQAKIQEQDKLRVQIEEQNKLRTAQYHEEQQRIIREQQEQHENSLRNQRYQEMVAQQTLYQSNLQRQLEEYKSLQYIFRKSQEMFSQALGVPYEPEPDNDNVEPVFHPQEIQSEHHFTSNNIIDSIPLVFNRACFMGGQSRSHSSDTSEVWVNKINRNEFVPQHDHRINSQPKGFESQLPEPKSRHVFQSYLEHQQSLYHQPHYIHQETHVLAPQAPLQNIQAPQMDYYIQGPNMSHSNVMGNIPTHTQDCQPRATNLISKDFNDWIEQGLFKQIQVDGQPGKNYQRLPTGLSLIDEVPEERSECSPFKVLRDRPMQPKEEGQKSLINPRLAQDIGSGFRKSTSAYAHENMDLTHEPKPYNGESSLSFNFQPDNLSNQIHNLAVQRFQSSLANNYFHSINVEPSMTNRLETNEVEEPVVSQIPVIVSQASHNNSNLSVPNLKVIGSTLYYQQTRLGYRNPQLTEYAIHEAAMDEEEEGPRDRKVKEMTPNRSIEFKPHHINTDASNSIMKGEERDSTGQNVVFPSLRFSSAKMDKSIQARNSTPIDETATTKLNFECNNFIFMDPNPSIKNNINAYMIEAIHVDGHKKQVMSESTQADFLSPYLAGQVMQELLKSKDFSSQGIGSDQPFTVTVSQDQGANNNYIINVEIAPDNEFENTANFDRNEKVGLTEHQVLSSEFSKMIGLEMTSQNKPSNHSGSIREMQSTGGIELPFNQFDFKKKLLSEFGNKTGEIDICDPDHKMSQSVREEEDEVTIDNPLLKHYDSVNNPNIHVMFNRSSDDRQYDDQEQVVKSASSEMATLNRMSLDLDYQQYQQQQGTQLIRNQASEGKIFRLPLEGIQEYSNEESDKHQQSRQLAMDSQYKEAQSELYNSRACEKYVAETCGRSDQKSQRAALNNTQGVSSSRKDLLNIIHEELNPSYDYTNTTNFADFFRKPDEILRTGDALVTGSQDKKSQRSELSNLSSTGKIPSPLEIEDYIQRSIKRAEVSSEKSMSQRSEKLIVAAPIKLDTQNQVEESAEVEVKAITKRKSATPSSIKISDRRGSPIPKKPIAAAVYTKLSDTKIPKLKDKSKSVKRKEESIQVKKPSTVKPVFAEGDEDLEPIQIKIPEYSNNRSSLNSSNPQDRRKSTTSSKSVTRAKPGDNKPTVPSRSPTPIKSKVMTDSDYMSVSQLVKKTLDEPRVRVAKEEAKVTVRGSNSPISPITDKTRKRSVTPTRGTKNTSGAIIESQAPKDNLKRESSPYAPEKYKQTIQTLFQDQMGPRRKPGMTDSKINNTTDEETHTVHRNKRGGNETSLTHYNQVSDSENYSEISGHHLVLPKESVKDRNSKNKSLVERHQTGKVDPNYSRIKKEEQLEIEVNKSHRSTKSYLPQTGYQNMYDSQTRVSSTKGKLANGSSSKTVQHTKNSAINVGSPQISIKSQHAQVKSPPGVFKVGVSTGSSISKNVNKGRISQQTFGKPERVGSSRNSRLMSSGSFKPEVTQKVRQSTADNELRDRILNEFLTSLCNIGFLKEEDCENESFFNDNLAIMIEHQGMVLLCAEMGFIPQDFDPENPEFDQ